MRSALLALWPPNRKLWLPLAVIAMILMAHLLLIQWAQDSLEFMRLLDADNEPVEIVLRAPTPSVPAQTKPAAPKKIPPADPTPVIPAPAAVQEVNPAPTAPRVDTASETNNVPNSESTAQMHAEGNASSTASVSPNVSNDVPEKKSEPEAATALKANAAPFLFEHVSFPPSAELRYNALAAQGARSLSGSGNIVWQHDGQSYTLKGEASALLLSLLSYQSSGQLGKTGILPDLYYEKRIGKSATQTHFVRERKTISFSASTATYEIQGGEQDRGSVIWQLVGIARGDPTKLEPGLMFETVIAGSKAADRWRVQVSSKESLTLTDGAITAWHFSLTPAVSSFDYQIDLWLSPEKEWYPVKIMYANRAGANLTMTLEKIQQK
ncbi:MAG: DUF3108 domain-containing protein [Sulfuritalea sp.]|nr:DUF3108 domain-containing protein [Polynucleobacter sp.]MCF8187752.1 DUF3108 domain-containing protein [Sulfuritalea sp.]